MTREEAIRWLEDIHRRFNPTGENLENEGGDVHLQALDMAIEALKEKNQSDSLVTDSSDACKENKSKLDLVRRQAVLDALEESGYCYRFWIDIENVINSLPSAEPKTGKWMLKEHLWECDQCGCRINRAKPLKGNIWNYNFCPNCGARMEVRKNDER